MRKKHYSLDKNSMVPHLNKLKSPSPKDALCQVWLKLAQWFWRRIFDSLLYYRYFVIFSPWERAVSFIIKLESHSPKDACAKVWLKLAEWFWKKKPDFSNFVYEFPLFRYYVLGGGGWRRRFFKISFMYICYFVIFSPWKRAWPLIWINLKPHHPRMHSAKFGWNWPSGSWEDDVPTLVEIGPVVLEKKMWKVYWQTDRRADGRTDGLTTDNRWSEKLTWVFSPVS